MTIAQNQKPSHQSFHRFILDDLTMSIEDIFYDINKLYGSPFRYQYRCSMYQWYEI